MVPSRSRSDYEITRLFETRSILQMNIIRKLIWSGKPFGKKFSRWICRFQPTLSLIHIKLRSFFLWYFAPPSFFFFFFSSVVILHDNRSTHRQSRNFLRIFQLIATATFPLPLQVENCWKRRDAAPFRPRQLSYISIDYGYDSLAIGKS